MIVMPSFAHSQHANNGVIAAFIVADIRPRAPQVTNRVHAPGDMVSQEDSHQTAPNEPGNGPAPATYAQTDGSRQKHSQERPEWEQSTHGSQHRASPKVAGITIEPVRHWSECPANMSVPESAKQPPKPFPVGIRRVGVAILIAVLVVQTMPSHPGKQWSLEGHRSKNSEDELDRPHSLERPMCKQSVESDCDSEHSESVHSSQQAYIKPSKSPSPNALENGGGDHSEEWNGHADERAKPSEDSPT